MKQFFRKKKLQKKQTCLAFSSSSSKMICEIAGSLRKKWKNKSISTSENRALNQNNFR